MTSYRVWTAVGGLLCTVWLMSRVVFAGYACLSNPCLYGICMDELNSTYSCYCIDGYTGVQCQTNWNECWSSPCTNGGTCIDGIASYNCTCPDGFIGPNCEINYDECDSNPCLNNATCYDANNSYTCQCQPGFKGIHCEVDVAVCNITGEERCANDGLCVEGPGFQFYCRCKPGWTGTLCDIEVNECDSSPCQNGGVCIDLLATYSCACYFGYTGQNCEENILMCDNSPCENDALCLLENDQIVCYCVPDFHGDRCQYQYDECQLGPRCMNGGTCIDGIDTATCSCPPNLTGKFCECLILANNTYDCHYIRPTPYDIPTTTTEEYTTTISTTFSTIILPSETSPSTTDILVPNDITTSAIQLSMETKSTETSMESSTTEYFEAQTQTTDLSTPSVFQDGVFYSSSIETTTLHSEDLTILIDESMDETTTSTAITNQVESRDHELDPFETTTELYRNETMEEMNCKMYPCKNGGTCVITSEGPRCVCRFDTEGHQCQVVLDVENAAFSGDSYLSHPLYHQTSIQVEIHAKTLSSNGLIFYCNLGRNAYMTLYILNGLLKFQFSCGLQTMVLSEMEITVNNGYEMKIHAHLEYAKNFTHCNATVKLNDTLSMSGDQSAVYNFFDQTYSWLHFGGIPQQYLHAQAPQLPGFMGCIHLLQEKYIDDLLLGNRLFNK